MQLTSAPAKLVEAFAAGGNYNVIPVPSQIAITPGAASWTDGFPPLTMTAVAAGGVPPSGLDFNGIFNALSQLAIWFNAGAGFGYDPTFSSTVGGYPKGAKVLAASGVGYWLSTVDNNTTDPDTGGAGWVLAGVTAASSVYANSQLTVAAGTNKVLFNTVEFDDGIWNAGNSRFQAPFAGRYRVSGAITFNAPSGQNLEVAVYRNGTLAKVCFQAAQVSTGNLTMPFDAILNCAAADYLEIFIVTTAGVNLGVVGSNQQYVFAQCSYMGT